MSGPASLRYSCSGERRNWGNDEQGSERLDLRPKLSIVSPTNRDKERRAVVGLSSVTSLVAL